MLQQEVLSPENKSALEWVQKEIQGSKLTGEIKDIFIKLCKFFIINNDKFTDFSHRILHMNVGPTIKKLRKQKGLNQTDFSNEIGITQTALSQIESGATSPHKSTLERICSGLGIPEQVLVILSLENEDVPDDKKLMFDTLYPTVKEFMLKIFYEHEHKELI